MSKFKGTPGPWYGKEIRIHSIHFEKHRSSICFSSDTGQVTKSNADLILAAPDLLKAAEMVLAWYEAKDDHSKTDFRQRLQMCRDSEDAIRAAIAKAKGNQQ